MPRVEFFYWTECPSYERALAILLDIMVEEHIQAPVEITRVKSEVEAELYQFYGSPTIRIDGVDIAPLPEDIARPSLICRTYRESDGRISLLPPRELIEASFQRSSLVPSAAPRCVCI